MIYILASGKSGKFGNAAILESALEPDKKNNWAEVLLEFPAGGKIKGGDQVYLDISGLSQADLKKTLGQIKKCDAFWGIVDPLGVSEDPASFFFDGAIDYIGPALIKKGLSKKRFALAFSQAIEKSDPYEAMPHSNHPVKKAPKREGQVSKKTDQKFIAGKFEGWKSVRPGTTDAFFFLFVSLSGKSDLRSTVGEVSFKTVKNRLNDVLQQVLWKANALLWMETEGSSLFLVPSGLPHGKAAIEETLKIILNSKLIGLEKLGLSVPVEFTCALHYGQTVFQPPGKTGSVISETVNYIFHLGSKKAEEGRLTISGDVPEEVFSSGLQDFFSPAGVFEGIPVRQSKRFVYK